MTTVPAQVAALVQAVEQNTAATISARAGVNGKADEAAASATTALSSKNLAEAASSAAQSAAANAQAIAASDLSAAAQRIIAADNVRHVFIYDTTQDTDGGAWRHKVADRSWTKEPLNTATRGPRAMFPSKALVVHRQLNLDIYDLDDPACPLWMTFQSPLGGSFNSWNDNTIPILNTSTNAIPSALKALNGYLYYGHDDTRQGFYLIDFLSDYASVHHASMARRYNGNIAQRNAHLGYTYPIAGPLIASADVHDIAATILPGTRPNPNRLGLPNPTVAVATEAGVSVIHADGRVCNSALTNRRNHVDFASDGTLFVGGGQGAGNQFAAVPPQEYSTANWGYSYFLNHTTVPAIARNPDINVASQCLVGDLYVRGGTGGPPARGLTLLHRNTGRLSDSMVVRINASHNSGWQPGDTRLALTASTADLADLVESSPLDDDFSSYADTAAMLAAGWTDASSPGASWSLDAENNQLTFITNGSNNPRIRIVVSTVPGAYYRLAPTLLHGSDSGWGLVVQDYPSFSEIVGYTANAEYVEFQALSSQVRVQFTAVNDTVLLGALRVERAHPDLSAANQRILPRGSVPRVPVASGAELAAFRCNNTNFIEIPDAASDEITGDFFWSFWVNTRTTNEFYLGTTGAVGFPVEHLTPGWHIRASGPTGSLTIRLTLASGSPVVEGAPAVRTPDGIWDPYAMRWTQACITKHGTEYSVFLDGRLVHTSNGPASLPAGGPLRIHGSNTAGVDYTLSRLGPHAPTAEDIRAIYEAERPLFEENAKCLLATSDFVESVAADPQTNQFYVGKQTGGTDIFRGLTRVDTLSMASLNTFGSNQVTNGTFDTDTDGWAQSLGEISAENGWLRVTRVGGNEGRAVWPLTCEVGKTYEVRFDQRSDTLASGVTLAISAHSADGAVFTEFTATLPTFISQFTATQGSHWLMLRAGPGNDGDFVEFTNVQVREVINNVVSSDDHSRSIAASGGIVALGTTGEATAFLPAIPQREAATTALMGHNGGPAFDPDAVPFTVVTTDATPTALLRFPVAPGKSFGFSGMIYASEHQNPAGEAAAYRVEGRVRRPLTGDVTVTATVTVIDETTGSMDLTATANASLQQLALTGTGVAATHLIWRGELTLTEIA